MSGKKVIIIPCSGIGKPLGTVTRQATHKIVDELMPEKTMTVCLAKLVAGDEDAVKLVRENPCIALDGCPKECARKNIELAGVSVQSEFRVLDVYKDHTDLKPESVLHLGEAGEKLVDIIAGKVCKEADRLLTE